MMDLQAWARRDVGLSSCHIVLMQWFFARALQYSYRHSRFSVEQFVAEAHLFVEQFYEDNVVERKPFINQTLSFDIRPQTPH